MKKVSPELKKILQDANISGPDCDKKLTERSAYVMHTYIKLIHLRLKHNIPSENCVDQVQNSRICELMTILDNQGDEIPQKRKCFKPS
jgi:hypothetical protein